MRFSTVIAAALSSTSVTNVMPTPVSYEDLLAPYRDPEAKRALPPINVAKLPNLDDEDKEVLKKLYNIVQDSKKVKVFLNAKLPVTAVEATKLGRKLGKSTLNKLDATPGQPISVITAFLTGVIECAVKGKSAGDVLECGKSNVLELGDNTSIEVPERCSSILGQFEIPGTGWPARCHDTSIKQHKEGNAVRRWWLRGLCKAFSGLEGKRLAEAQRRHGQPLCNERFPSNAMITMMEADKQLQDKLKADRQLSAKIEETHGQLVTFRREVEDRISVSGGSIAEADIDKAASLIAAGAFPAFVHHGQPKDAKELADWYMGAISAQGRAAAPALTADWAVAGEVAASEIPQDNAATKAAYVALNDKPYRSLFQPGLSLEGSEKCYAPPGLNKTQPTGWVTISAALVYLNDKMRDNQRACKGCAQDSNWVLRCSSA